LILCITEKPSVARDIAAILGANSRHEGFFEGNGYCVTWTFGHLCCLKDPADYTDMWKRWSLGTLPMIPAKFGIKLIKDRGIEQQFKVIQTLIHKADEVINCGDAGQEGELIQRWVMQKAKTKCPVKRLWISSLTDESIKKGFQDLKPEADFNNLYYSGLSRAIGDWVLGLNATRLYTLKYSAQRGNILSVGRVQTPTLALIVERHRAIENFKPEDFWELQTTYRETLFNANTGKFKTEEDASALLSAIKSNLLTITDVEEKSGREAPKRLFDLTSLQVECNKQWGWTADETLKLIQSLYEKKVTTYPRVDTTYLSTDIYKKIPDILRKMEPYSNITAPVLARPITKSKKIFDDSKVTDHHAIIPTGESPSRLVGNERLMYHLIATRFIAAFYPDCIFKTTTVIGVVPIDATAGLKEKEVKFKATGKVIVEPGWRVLYEKNVDDDKDENARILPPFTVGESGPHIPSLAKKTTQPPKYYTEGTLLRAMETAGKDIDDDELRDALKENGIGRPSTRSAIIETLFKRGYIVRERKNILATQAGCALIDTIQEGLLKSAKLTGLWENKLRRIERGEYRPDEFINEIKELINSIVINVLSDNSQFRIITDQKHNDEDGSEEKKKTSKASPNKTAAKTPRKPPIKSLEQIQCPACTQGHIIKGKTAYGCSRFREGCTLRLNFSEYSPDITPAKLNQQIAKAFKKKRS
jgi:DNA topoisomerase-3